MKFSERFPLASNSEIGQVRQLVRGEKNLIDLGFGDVNFDTPDHIREAAKNALDEGYTHYVLPSEGIKELRDAIADKLLRDNNIKSDPDTDIVVTPGVQQAVNIIMQSILNPGDEVIIADPCWMAYPNAIQFPGGKVQYVPVREERNFRIAPEDIEKVVNKNTKLIVLVSPDNPTGSCLTKEDMEKIGEIALKNNLLVLSDEIYEKYIWTEHGHYSMAAIPEMKNNVVTINGFSKNYAMTGWRIGYIVTANKDLMNNIKALHAQYVATINSFVQKGAIAALIGDQKPINNMIKQYEKRMNLMVEKLNKIEGITCHKPGGSFYVYPSVKGTGMTSFDFAKLLAKEAKVLVYPGTAFGPNAGKYYLRLSLSVTESKIIEATERIAKAVASIKK